MTSSDTEPARAGIVVQGAVQGVGFRPFVHRLAVELGLAGWVRNEGGRVVIEVEGAQGAIDSFASRLTSDRPPEAVVHETRVRFLETTSESGFTILESADGGSDSVHALLPDLAVCGDCVREILDPRGRRFGYPFTHCARCGPRYTLVDALPWDRERTAMKGFPMCAACEAEFRDPQDRRFHAQTLACPECGPRLGFLDAEGRRLAEADEALVRAVEALRRGEIVAVKATGGFQLLVDAENDEAVRRLRKRKAREAKPLAVLVRDLATVQSLCRVAAEEEALLVSLAAPMVLLDRSAGPGSVAPSVAPGNPRLGVMLPSTPLHHLLAMRFGSPLVATSGNRSGEPLCIGNGEAMDRLAGIADGFLVHDRPILRPVDDSVVQVVEGGVQVLRRTRGYAPLTLRLKKKLPVPMIAAGAFLKNTVALGMGDRVFLSQHLGDLDTVEARELHERTALDLAALTGVEPELRIRDAHPDFHAGDGGPMQVSIQHHLAHVAACMAENELEAPVLGIVWDGMGFGMDGTLWGGEFLRVEEGAVARVAHLRTFPLPGGDAAAREPRRSALGCGFEMLGDAVFSQSGNPFLRRFDERELRVLRQALELGIHSPASSSMGRLFDAVASLLNLRQVTDFEGQAAMDVEFAAQGIGGDAYAFRISDDEPAIIDWSPMIRAILVDLQNGVEVRKTAACFHETIVEVAVTVALRAGVEDVALTGGCFQNRRLTERLAIRLREEGFRPHWHREVPANDGGLALGQVIAASWKLDGEASIGHDEGDCPV